MTVVHSIARAWLSTGGTGARNYDEFADDAEITDIVAANPDSALAIEMPHRAPESLGKTFTESLPDAVDRLRRQRDDGSYALAQDVLVLYRIEEPGQPDTAAYGLFAMVDTDQISTSADEPGLVIRNEDVFIEKVRERVALAEATQHLLSPVLLLRTGRGDELHQALQVAVESAGAPAVTDTDHVGRTHALWPVRSRELAELAGSGELVVADGNHRSLAAQTGGLPRFLAVITTPASVAIQPYHRLVSHSPVPLADLLDRLRAAGATISQTAPVIPATGTIVLYAAAPGSGASTGSPAAYAVTLPPVDGATIVDGMDHAQVERIVLGDALGLAPGDKRITYVGGDYPPEWLVSEVDSGRADLAVLIAPVTVDAFVAVNLARQKMPRKSTWFTPKARGGLVLADLTAEG
jgi:uncharacterized protein (DUF1015 family)